MKNICVYCSSSSVVKPVYFTAARELGILLAQNDYTLIYGGARVGLMGELAHAVHSQKGRIVGVIPEAIRKRDIVYEQADEIIYTKDLRDRKAVMDSRSDAFMCLPGGFGTLEEMLEIVTFKQLQLHNRPLVFINTGGFYDRLISFFEYMYEEDFAKYVYKNLYYIARNSEMAIPFIKIISRYR